jgi:hypothetical protein
MRNSCRITVSIAKWKVPLRIYTFTNVFVVEMDKKRLGCKDVAWTYQAVCTEKEHRLDHKAMSIQFP